MSDALCGGGGVLLVVYISVRDTADSLLDNNEILWLYANDVSSCSHSEEHGLRVSPRLFPCVLCICALHLYQYISVTQEAIQLEIVKSTISPQPQNIHLNLCLFR